MKRHESRRESVRSFRRTRRRGRRFLLQELEPRLLLAAGGLSFLQSPSGR